MFNLNRAFESKCYTSQSEVELGTYNYYAMVGKVEDYWSEVEFLRIYYVVKVFANVVRVFANKLCG